MAIIQVRVSEEVKKQSSKLFEQLGLDKMTLEEINEEIKQYRKERRKEKK